MGVIFYALFVYALFVFAVGAFAMWRERRRVAKERKKQVWDTLIG